MPLITSVAVVASAFVSTLGVNTHIDFNQYGYNNLTNVQNALVYLGVQNVRDSGTKSTTLQTWSAVALGAGIKFDDYMPEGSPASMANTKKARQSFTIQGTAFSCSQLSR